MATEVSLYVPCYNAERFIARCLDGVASQTRPPDEVLVIDDGCTDRTIEIASRFPVEIIRHPKNRGLAAARNSGIRAASFPLVASLDADSVPRATWLQRLLVPLEQPGIAAAGGRLIESNFDRLADRWRTRHMPQQWGPEPLRAPKFLFGNNTVFRRAALEKVGLYNENLRTNHEDVAMSAALIAAGETLVYEPTAIVDHLRQDTIASVLRTNWKWRFFGYDRPITLENLLRSGVQQFGWELTRYVYHDVRAADLTTLALSCVAVPYAFARNAEYYFRHRGAPSVMAGQTVRPESKRPRSPTRGG